MAYTGGGRRMVEHVDLAGVVAAAVALLILLDISVLWIVGRPVPELLSYLATSVFGFYFGRDTGRRVRAGPPGPRPLISRPVRIVPPVVQAARTGVAPSSSVN